MVADTTEKNPAHAGKLDVSRIRAHFWLRGDQLNCLFEFLAQGFGSLRTILTPPASGLLDVPRSTASEAHGKDLAHS